MMADLTEAGRELLDSFTVSFGATNSRAKYTARRDGLLQLLLPANNARQESAGWAVIAGPSAQRR
jgi:hypothetical protein